MESDVVLLKSDIVEIEGPAPVIRMTVRVAAGVEGGKIQFQRYGQR